MATKGRSTQHIANSFPEWANIRTDEQSLGFQFLNVIGKQFTDLKQQQEHIAENHYINTALVNDIDVFYSFQLPRNYVFTKEDGDDTPFTYTPPTVSGILNDMAYGVSIASNNDIETFWYDAVPDRITLNSVVSGEHWLVSGYLDGSPFPIATESGLCHTSNHLTIKLNGGVSFFGIEDNNFARRGIVQIEGITRQGAEITEELVFLQDETQQTFHEFKSIEPSGVRVYGINNADETYIEVTSANFNADDYPLNYTDLDTWVGGESKPLFWALGSGTVTTLKTLDLVSYDVEDFDIRLAGFTSKSTIMQQELRDENNERIIPLDLAVEPYSDRIWVVDSGNLYVYSAELPFVSFSGVQGKNYESASVIDPETYYTVSGENLEFDYLWRRPTTGLIAHRAWVQKPDGNKYSLEGGAEITYHTGATSWIYGEPRTRKLRASEYYTLDQLGDYVYTIETRYTDETTEIDKRVVSVLYQRPLAQFDISSMTLGPAVGVDIDSEHKVWVLDSQGGKYQIDKHYDNMIIDFDRKIIYFREEYDKVKVW